MGTPISCSSQLPYAYLVKASISLELRAGAGIFGFWEPRAVRCNACQSRRTRNPRGQRQCLPEQGEQPCYSTGAGANYGAKYMWEFRYLLHALQYSATVWRWLSDTSNSLLADMKSLAGIADCELLRSRAHGETQGFDTQHAPQEDLVSRSRVLALLCLLAGPVKQNFGTKRAQANHLLARFLALGGSCFPETCQLHIQVWLPTSVGSSSITVEL